jgi:hypothetical protein
MFRLLLCVALLCLGGKFGVAAPFAPQPGPSLSGRLCRPAIEAAERRHRIPSRLLTAIGRVESGRRDPADGSWNPWPWTINAEGQGAFFDTKAQAIAAVRDLQSRGVRSIDVGCMQVNLMHHPDAFASLEQAFDPAANAEYAASFLERLYSQSGAWPRAAALYHSATPELGDAYQRRVLAVWPEEQNSPSAPSAVASAWAATLPRPASYMPLRQIGMGGMGRILPLPAGPGGTMPPGRGLDSYRVAPVIARFLPR